MCKTLIRSTSDQRPASIYSLGKRIQGSKETRLSFDRYRGSTAAAADAFVAPPFDLPCPSQRPTTVEVSKRDSTSKVSSPIIWTTGECSEPRHRTLCESRERSIVGRATPVCDHSRHVGRNRDRSARFLGRGLADGRALYIPRFISFPFCFPSIFCTFTRSQICVRGEFASAERLAASKDRCARFGGVSVKC